MSAARCPLFVSTIVCLVAVEIADPPRLLRTTPAVKSEVIEKELLLELQGLATSPERQRHLASLEEFLGSAYVALPKGTHGSLEHSTVRYILHRFFMQRYSWFFRGLEPGARFDQNFPSSTRASFSLDSAPVWPAFLQREAEKFRGESGLSLQGIASLAATLEDLAHYDTVDRLSMAYDADGLTPNDSLDSNQVSVILQKFTILFISGWNMTNFTHEALTHTEQRHLRSRRWHDIIRPYLVDVEEEAFGNDGFRSVSFDAMTKLADTVTKNFSNIFAAECKEMKDVLTTREDRKAGRIRLSDFYNMSRASNWAFVEKIEYLRTLGAVDEANASNPLVIIPNYVTAMTQCMKASSMYFVCCPNECEGLMSHVESDVGAPEATPERIVSIVSALASDTVSAPRVLSAALQRRLQEVADRHGGNIPLHGRLFAQWMHHAYPRECPYPHEIGTTSPVTPDEWITQSGHEDAHASEMEMLQHIREDDTCRADTKDGCGEAVLPWNPVEELLHLPRGRGSDVQMLASLDREHVTDGEAETAMLIEGSDSEIEESANAAVPSHEDRRTIFLVMISSAMMGVAFLRMVILLIRAYGADDVGQSKCASDWYLVSNAWV
eukprot:TRINITY_DN2966_c0_g1_i1.p1 TRINITY_DN2966_c0_g1~~TRINITY_DN2966_c0_g1_i1.p1  ORF type:complete len:609 (-),score=80.99 TRINITY_DN2966_c0_g1_i1:57-1883(-)